MTAAEGLRRRPNKEPLRPGDQPPSLSTEDTGPGPLSQSQVVALKRKQRMRRFKSFLHVLGWLAVAGFVLVHTQFFDVLFYDSRVGQ